MTKLIKKIVPSLLLAVIVGLTCCCGCGPGYTPTAMPWTEIAPEDLTQAQWQDILDVSLEYHEHLDSYKVITMTSVNTDASGGENPWESSRNTSLSGFRNLEGDKGQMTMQLSTILKGLGSDGEEQAIYYDTYQPDDWMYVSIVSGTLGSYWVKVKKSAELEMYFKFDSAERQLALLDTATSIEYLRTENINDIDYYLLSVKPNKAALATWVSQEDTGLQELDWQQLLNNVDPYEDFNFTCYVTKDSYLIMGLSMTMAVEFTPIQGGNTTYDYDSVKLSLNMDIGIYQYNVIELVTLPTSANSAREVSSDVFIP